MFATKNNIGKSISLILAFQLSNNRIKRPTRTIHRPDNLNLAKLVQMRSRESRIKGRKMIEIINRIDRAKDRRATKTSSTKKIIEIISIVKKTRGTTETIGTMTRKMTNRREGIARKKAESIHRRRQIMVSKGQHRRARSRTGWGITDFLV